MSAHYYAVIFTSLRTEGDQGYAEAAERMLALAREQPGFLGIESARGDDGLGITVSYWRARRGCARSNGTMPSNAKLDARLAPASSMSGSRSRAQPSTNCRTATISGRSLRAM
jgi:hypothetical protein